MIKPFQEGPSQPKTYTSLDGLIDWNWWHITPSWFISYLEMKGFVVCSYLHFSFTCFLRNLFSFFFFFCTRSSWIRIIFLNRPKWRIDEYQTGISTLGYSGLCSNGNKGLLQTTQISKTGPSPSDAVSVIHILRYSRPRQTRPIFPLVGNIFGWHDQFVYLPTLCF